MKPGYVKVRKRTSVASTEGKRSMIVLYRIQFSMTTALVENGLDNGQGYKDGAE